MTIMLSDKTPEMAEICQVIGLESGNSKVVELRRVDRRVSGVQRISAIGELENYLTIIIESMIILYQRLARSLCSSTKLADLSDVSSIHSST